MATEDIHDLPMAIEEYEKNLEEELSKQFKNKIGQSVFILEAVKFLKCIDLNIDAKCANEIKNFRAHFKLDSERDEKVFPREGMESSADKAYRELEQCTERFKILEANVNEIVQFSSDFYDYQYHLCRFNCLKKLRLNKMPKIQTCLRRCYFYTYEYIDRAIEDALQIYIADKNTLLDDEFKI